MTTGSGAQDETSGTALHDTYLAALQQDNVELPVDTWIVGVVNMQIYGFGNAVDTNFECLGPPDDLFDEFRDTRNSLESGWMSNVEAHNCAWGQLAFEFRYLRYLHTGWQKDTDIRNACDAILEGLQERPVALVCYEGKEKFCHRTVLKQFITSKTAPHS